ncbi:MAG TPA: hypothetical protein VHE81_06855 [Lacipirellulaceae bacterium]|nr:hypothetical protein [Lacipirellulaceae bacterium]
MTDHSQNAPKLTSHETQSPPRHLIRGFRAALTLAIVMSACYVSYGFGRLWHEWRQIGTANAAARAASSHAGPDLLPLTGQWSFGGLNWNLRSQKVPCTEIARRFETLATYKRSCASTDLPDVGNKLVDLARQLHIEPIQRGSNQIYRVDQPGLKAQLVVGPVNGRPGAISLAAAFGQSTDEWQLLEFTPRNWASVANNDTPHLLPLPAAARRQAGRFSDDGRLLLELVTVDSDADTLLAMWKQQGWQFRPTPFAGPNDFSYLCGRGSDVIYAWSASPRESLHNLMLVRAPASADTQ